MYRKIKEWKRNSIERETLEEKKSPGRVSTCSRVATQQIDTRQGKE